jgi:hypothetical protein
MSIVYLNINIQIHGLKIDEQEVAENLLMGWLKAETMAILKGSNAPLFNFRDEFESDIEVDITDFAGIAEHPCNQDGS